MPQAARAGLVSPNAYLFSDGEVAPPAMGNALRRSLPNGRPSCCSTGCTRRAARDLHAERAFIPAGPAHKWRIACESRRTFAWTRRAIFYDFKFSSPLAFVQRIL